LADARVHFLPSPLQWCCNGSISRLFLAANLLPQSVPFTLRNPFQLICCPGEIEKKKEGIYSCKLSIKTIIPPCDSPFCDETTTRQYRTPTASPAKTLFHLSGLIPTVTTDRSINTRPHYQKMKMAIHSARSMYDQYLNTNNAAFR